MKILYQIPTFFQRLYRGVVWRLSPEQRTVYLTFDDGCVPEVTPLVLDILESFDVKATFFCVGDNIRKYPEVFRRIVAEGHAVGNHTYHHIKGIKTDTEQYLKDIADTDRLISKYLPEGQTNQMLFRPPYGKMKFSQKRIVERNHTIVLWDVLTHDYNRNYTPEHILQIVKRCVRNGSIIVFHDSLKAYRQMSEALPYVIDYLKSEGYDFSTLYDLTISDTHTML